MKKLAYLLAFGMFFMPLINYRVDTGAVYALSLFDLAIQNKEAAKFMLLIDRIDQTYLHINLIESGIGYAFYLLWAFPAACFMALVSSLSAYRSHEDQIRDNMAAVITVLLGLVLLLTLSIRLLTNQSGISLAHLLGAGLYILPACLLILLLKRKNSEAEEAY